MKPSESFKVYAHPSFPKTFHLFLIVHIIHCFEILFWDGEHERAVDRIYHANFFDMVKVCPEIQFNSNSFNYISMTKFSQQSEWIQCDILLLLLLLFCPPYVQTQDQHDLFFYVLHTLWCIFMSFLVILHLINFGSVKHCFLFFFKKKLSLTHCPHLLSS